MEVTSTPVRIGTSVGLIQNLGPDILYIGGESVTVEDGFAIVESEAVAMGYSENDIYVVSEGTSDVRTLGRGMGVYSSVVPEPEGEGEPE